MDRCGIVVDRCGIVVERCGSLWVVVGRCGIVAGSLWLVVDRCGSLWIVVGRCGSLWVVVGRCGSLWVVVGRCGSFRVLVTLRISFRSWHSRPQRLFRFRILSQSDLPDLTGKSGVGPAQKPRASQSLEDLADDITGSPSSLYEPHKRHNLASN